MSNDFAKSVRIGLQLSARISYGADGSVKAPTLDKMEKSTEYYVPTAPMVYAVIVDPSIVDNPNIPSYQPYVHGRCDPPALIPLSLYGIEAEIECFLDSAFVTVSGVWRLHCVSGGKSCDCRIALPMGEQGSVLGIEVEVMGRSYRSQQVIVEEEADLEGLFKREDVGFVTPDICSLKIPKVDGGSKLSIKARWSQKLSYCDGNFVLSQPYSFPAYVTPAGKFSKREKIQLIVNSGIGREVLCQSTSHPFKEVRREAGRLDFLYEAEVGTWSSSDIMFSFSVPSSDIFGGIILQSPPVHDFDQREMVSCYLFPGTALSRKVFRRRVVFVVDISGSMKGGPIENVKQALLASLSKLNPDDLFNIVAFNGDVYQFSSSLEITTQEAIQRATEWMSLKFIPQGGTNILLPLSRAIDLLNKEVDSFSLIFLITDGAVENERDICNVIKGCFSGSGSLCPRVATFGIGSFCNHYFLQMLAQIGRGHYAAAFYSDEISSRLERLFVVASSVLLANIRIESLECLENLTLYPSYVQDLSYGTPLVVSGRYNGTFPDCVEISGTAADMSKFTLQLKTQKAKDIPLNRVFARRHIDILTAKAWLLESKDLKEQVARLSMESGVPSEYTITILFEPDVGKLAPVSLLAQEKLSSDKIKLQKMISNQKLILLPHLTVGFGDLKWTAQNVPPGTIIKIPDATKKLVNATSICCQRLLDRICCMCCLNALSKMNDQCAIVFSQICGALACCECFGCCFDLCLACN